MPDPLSDLLLYQDESILVVNKPTGIPVLPDGWEQEAPYLVKQLEELFGRLWVVHRLDKGTSGVIIFARTAEAHRTLNLLFESRDVHKVYHAIVVGNPKWDKHTARHPLRVNVGHHHRTMVDPLKGKPSETTFCILKHFDGYALLSVIPATGRTHQVRVHAYALGFPLLGDTLYSAPETDLIPRIALHARSLEFALNNQPFQFNAPYPTDFEAALASLEAKRKDR
ncbi:MAG: RNA pseudouridine synthase [Chloroflexota bacterium]